MAKEAHPDWPQEALELIAELRREIAELRRRLAEAERGQKRQAAPFSKGAPKSEPAKPGRKTGANYGAYRQRSRPKRVDEVIDVPAPRRCPDCGGTVDEGVVHDQFQTELPVVEPRVVQFRVGIGVCRHCGGRVQGRHPRQTSDALGAAHNQIGPRALAVAAQLNKVYGLSYVKVAAAFGQLFGMDVVPSTFVRGFERLAVRIKPAYGDITLAVRRAPIVYPDETGWRVAGRLGWLWVFVSPNATLYVIRPSRGFDVIEEILGSDYAGQIGHDGWAPYDQLTAATHQTCLAHILRRCNHLLEGAMRGAARFPHAIKDAVKDALALRDRRHEISAHGMAVATGKLQARFNRLVEWQPTWDPNRKLAKHLRNHRDELLTFLRHPGLEATNWPSEQAIRPAVVNRKVFGGNRTWKGAQTQEILTSIFQTARNRGVTAVDFLASCLRTPPNMSLPVLASGP